ncbi:ribonuclease VapC9 [Luteimicrobium album]|uniref:Ribonuclease VapC n=1 Tax=Luteimicrobium album TaxID=1054550 RepID=A0ABQ6HZV7_9MICO|nr:type II toxin-antitoxin system VapC family toxin [Luteimicrobium album]GMA23055.1 ribonuclease VapC9 [Luteimicrobium album]
MIVLDASAWVCALVDAGDQGDASRAVLEADPDWLVPAHGPIETLRTVRRYEQAGVLGRDAAQSFGDAVVATQLRVVGPEPWLLAEVWELRYTVSPYDAPYVVLARRFDAALVTIDSRLARAASDLDVPTVVPGS